jgi:hypothetical protein
MQIEIIDGKFVITAGVELVIFAVTHGIENNIFDLNITDEDLFAKGILSALRATEEDGTNLIHRAFDKAAIDAIENGCEGVELP